MEETETRAMLNCLQKKDRSPEDTFGVELLQDPPNSLNSALSDFYLFPKLKTPSWWPVWKHSVLWRSAGWGGGRNRFP